MNTRLLGAAVLIALAVLFVPMFFSGKPLAPGDESVSLAIPPAPDRDLQTRTMSLNPDGAPTATAVQAPPPAAPGASGDQLATVNIGSNRPRDVELDPQAGKAPEPTTVTMGSGTSPAEPVIPLQGKTPAPATRPAVTASPAKVTADSAAKPAPASAPAATPAAVPAPSAPAGAGTGHGSYLLNLSAYASAANASALQRTVRSLGYPASSRPVSQAGKQLTQVVAGPFETRTAAEAARLKIAQAVPSVQPHLEQDASRDSAPAPAARAGNAARPAAPDSAHGWAVQLAALGNQADATALRDKLRASGFDGYVSAVQSAGKQLWQVRAGPQTQRADAQRVRDQIKAKLGLDGVVRQVP